MSPERAYVPRNEPPSWLDRIRSHRESSGMALVSVVVGALLLVSSVFTRYDPAPSLAELPDWISAVTGGLIFGGAALRLWSTVHYYSTLDEYWRDHRMACLAQGFGWSAYAVAAAMLRPYAQVPYLLGFSFALLPLWALLESILDEARVRGDRPCPRRGVRPPGEPH